MAKTKTITVQRGKNIGKAIINAFPNYPNVNIKNIDVKRDIINRVNVATVGYSII